MAITASPCGGCRQWLARVQGRRASSSLHEGEVLVRRPGRAPARTRSCCEVGVRRGRGAPERRQVDARERPRRRQGGDRLGQAADDPAQDLGGGRRRARAASRSSSCSSTCPASSGRATRSPSACSGRWTSPSGRRRLPASSSRRDERIGAGDRFVAERVFAAGPPVIVALNKVDRLQPAPDRRADRRGRRARRLPRAPSGERTQR